jgi:predicted DNA binding protein
MHQISLKLDHELPFSNVSKAFPQVNISRWCNREVDILEAESQRGGSIDRFESGLKAATKSLSASLIHIHRYSENALEAVIKCKCASGNSSIAIAEASNCIPIMPVTYNAGLEHLRLLAFSERDARAAIENLSAISTVTVEGRGRLGRSSARPAMTVSIDDFFSMLTAKQLMALVEAVERGFYDIPKKTTVEEMAAKLGVPRSTFEEHLRKAEVKIMRAVRPYARIAYLSD